MTASDGGSAFPEVVTDRDSHDYYNVHSVGGMSLRDYFATAELSKARGTDICDRPEFYQRLATHCYRMADAMLEVRLGSLDSKSG